MTKLFRMFILENNRHKLIVNNGFVYFFAAYMSSF